MIHRTKPAMKNTHFTLVTLVLTQLVLITIGFAEPSVKPFQLPDGGIRPQVSMDQSGIVHIIQADSKIKGRLLYLKHEPQKNQFSKPIQVLNQAEGMAAAYNMSLGKEGRMHVIMRPNPRYSKKTLGPEVFEEMFHSKARFFVLRYMLHARLNDEGTGFEEETNIAGRTIGFEGVGAIVADQDSRHVYAFWAGQMDPGPEMGRDLYMAISDDEGAHWSEPQKLDIDIEGNCRCCPIQATMDSNGVMYIVYRNSVKTSKTSWDKDTYLLRSEDTGKTWRKTLIQKWENCGCPGAPYSMTSGPTGVFFGFSTRGVSSFAKASQPNLLYPAPSGERSSTRPMVSVNTKGEVLFCWVEVQDVVWQVFDQHGKAMPGIAGRLKGVAARWSNAAVVATGTDDFLLYYDGLVPVSGTRK
jgi:hypothetical protein